MGDLIPIDPKVYKKNNKVWTTSLEVARVFGKRHKNVLQTIEKLECSENFRGLNFKPSSYLSEQNKTQPMYEMNRSGFSFLAMRFTGKEAARFQEEFVRAFDAMEIELMNQITIRENEQSRIMELMETLNDTLIDSSETNIAIREKVDDIGEQVFNRFDDMDKKINHLQNDMKEIKNNTYKKKPISRKDRLKHIKVVKLYFNGICPMCMKIEILNKLGRNENSEYDHFRNPRWNKLTDAWLICKECHHKLTYGLVNKEGHPKASFVHYQSKMEIMIGTKEESMQQTLWTQVEDN